MRKIIHFWLLLTLFACLATAQEKPVPSAAQSSEPVPTNCEYNISILTGAHRQAGDDGLIIMIARLGNGERRRELNQRRLHNARTFLVEFGSRSPDTIITAEGERVAGYGRVEFYVDGKMFSALAVGRNDDLRVGACSFEGANPCSFERERKLYPCLDRSSQIVRKQR